MHRLGRRFLRLFRFIEIFDQAIDVLSPGRREVGFVRRLLEFGKLSFLGMYFFLESLTIVRLGCCVSFSATVSVYLLPRTKQSLNSST
jgi:hypothetical protein